jgi:cytochrome P450
MDVSIPMAPGKLPVVGHTLRLRRDPIRFLRSLPPQGDLVKFQIGAKQVVMVCNAELTRQMLTDDSNFDKGGPLIKLVQGLVGDGLATCPHDRHRQYRRQIQPAFRPDRLPGYAPSVAGGVGAVVDGWQSGQVIDVPVEMRRLAIHASVRALFSSALPADVIDRMADDFTTFLVGVAQRVGRRPALDRLPTKLNREYVAAIARIRQTLHDMIAERRADGGEQDDVISALLTTDQDGRQTLSDEVIVDHAATFVAAPTATVASVLGWALYELVQNPNLADRLRAEVDAVLGGGPVRPEHLPDLQLTRRIVSEALRMYPTVWIMTRVVTKAAELGGHWFPAGSVLTYSPYLVQRCGDFYEDPDRFDPDRWDHTRHSPPPRHAFIPFGGGARQCIATEYSPNEMVIALATIAARWRLEPVSRTPLRPRAAVNLTARGLRIRTIERDPVSERRRTRSSLRRRVTRCAAGTGRPTRRRTWLI